MKITDIKTFYLKEKNIDARTDSSQDALLVKIETDMELRDGVKLMVAPVLQMQL